MKETSRLAGIAAISLLAVALFVINGCDESETPLATTNNHVSFTPCQQSELRSSSESSVDVRFTDEVIEIVYSDFEVTCDFTAVSVTHTLVNGVLNISQQATPSRADCVCYTDVSYTIDGVSPEEVNVIFINDVQVYCYNENYPKEVLFEEYSLEGTSCKWENFESNKVIIINSDEELSDYIVCAGNDRSNIDFLKHSLLLARGGATSGISYIDIDFSQETVDNYALNVNIHTTPITYPQPWLISIVTPKIDNEATIALNVQQLNY
jgi:hypothetical protein